MDRGDRKMDKFQIGYKIDELKEQHNDLIKKEIECKVQEYTTALGAQTESLSQKQLEMLLRTFALDVRVLSEQLLK